MSKLATITEVVVTPPSSATAPLFATPTYASSALIVPKDDNTGTVAMGTLATPINKSPISLPYLEKGYIYDLSKINIKTNGTDSVVVIYVQGNIDL